ncbi:hypothetical protein TNCV_1467381 [Trichonephila clavipes]|uniref:Uncharacterized protein n=1 Tax=Trichonephila clavipes TaxID=2585209 RepID=A0A8X6S4B8_TRICX|nr:hypothetical protein TNCV_1467381 [Trichonephila clavipes]
MRWMLSDFIRICTTIPIDVVKATSQEDLQKMASRSHTNASRSILSPKITTLKAMCFGAVNYSGEMRNATLSSILPALCVLKFRHKDFGGTHLRFDISMQQETKLPVRLVNTTNDRRLVQGHETPLRAKGDFEAVSSELDNGG